MSIEGGYTFMLKKYREWIYGTGVIIIVVTFYLLVMRAHTSGGSFNGGSLWADRQFQHNLGIWVVITAVIVILMVLVGYFTRSNK
jgi:hypothetical protein